MIFLMKYLLIRVLERLDDISIDMYEWINNYRRRLMKFGSFFLFHFFFFNFSDLMKLNCISWILIRFFYNLVIDFIWFFMIMWKCVELVCRLDLIVLRKRDGNWSFFRKYGHKIMDLYHFPFSVLKRILFNMKTVPVSRSERSLLPQNCDFNSFFRANSRQF